MSVKSILSLVFFAFLVNGSNAFWASAAADDEVLLDFRAGPKTSLGVFFQGNNLDKTIDLETEQFKGIVPPTGRSTQLIKAGDGFVIRSTDFKIRAKVIVWKNTDYKTKKEYPYKITMKNLNEEQALELQTEGGGYNWIDAGKYITQLSDIQHDYIFRDESGNTLAAIRLFPANEDEF
eukprot:CAMPEP_0113482740 /NCGR_PEP_ID=MMETSP0014_2-20120614/23077_1 /TAXON_ID=2857 /ORGANISM="Nitzschia sp." /LENGTH=177 /DNA_ID=CAMNT_0000376271 /DNA_START=66 /DNA_END=599 /DNA_ORIENTATION=- /assembly_acc=CAM_ASM_000159